MNNIRLLKRRQIFVVKVRSEHVRPLSFQSSVRRVYYLWFNVAFTNDSSYIAVAISDNSYIFGMILDRIDIPVDHGRRGRDSIGFQAYSSQ